MLGPFAFNSGRLWSAARNRRFLLFSSCSGWGMKAQKESGDSSPHSKAAALFP